MGRFHRHDDGTVHQHEHEHEHDSAVATDLGDHTGYETGADRIDVLERIFDENDRAAAANRAAFDAQNVTCVNLMSAPGAGKTALLQRSLGELRDRGVRTGVIEGDIETSIDADRLAGLGAQISLLNTGNGFGGECHLDAPMVARALTGLRLADLDLLLVENVGNLVCPAEFDVGAHSSAMVYAVTEGEEKPLKYPVMFRAVDLVVVNKIDLLPYLDFDIDLFEANLDTVNPTARTIRVSTKTGVGLPDWLDWVTAPERR
ncbi:MAG: hydrogenase nickel incorporation protein HypB [Gordonia sp.]|jgi:hydrogenase nickel incorporation protein HypB|uniref:hydrogenase nickel incorporation protein HypB n=1 Tax=Gordonia sp. (in: high G+C Gram-positive bacteria) TaxID=84139 RepID=UPI001DEF78F8|nr:hydrogenase nickel incorporation protein HypB [Gordonia sp. (in: high G+C Gram-positive bacteria)]MCB1293294.1 hydrogenase nickel incorporation protein HypB [Gordonia sp. (in: high G+C Gram-positive bacteria)]HQV19374.1 hydrogenase nickel incorporation protein HypB [Gordonia sp. (in: high G+C Gram-positive bacteria)]